MGPDLDAAARFARHLADLARGLFAAAEAGGDGPTVELKPDRSFVTALDKAIEARLRAEIEARYPDHGIWGEEAERRHPHSGVQWVLDPIDGTAPFIAGVPVHATLIALALDGVPVLGLADFPALDRRYLGIAGAGTSLNDRPCRTRACSALDRAMLACMNPDFFAPGPDLAALDRLRAATHWRIYGTSALGYGLLAGGRLDLALDASLQVYDFAAFRPIVEGAGGRITDWAGAPLTLASGPRLLAAGTQALHEAAGALLL